MALGELTRQLAQQALLSNSSKEPAHTPAAAPDQLGPVILGQIAAMQKAVKEEEELVLIFSAGAERIRVHEIFLPSWRVAVLSGVDAAGAPARAIAPVDSLQLVARVARVQPGAKPARISLLAPKPKDSSAK